MRRLLSLCAWAVAVASWINCAGAESFSFRDTYVWEEFTLTKEKPETADGRFRLKHVSLTGSVELRGNFESDVPEVRVVKSLERALKAGDGFPWIVVKESSWRKQSATIRILRVRCEEVPNK